MNKFVLKESDLPASAREYLRMNYLDMQGQVMIWDYDTHYKMAISPLFSKEDRKVINLINTVIFAMSGGKSFILEFNISEGIDSQFNRYQKNGSLMYGENFIKVIFCSPKGDQHGCISFSKLKKELQMLF